MQGFCYLIKKNHPRTWESPTLKYAGIISQLLFEVTDKLALFEIIQTKFLHVVCIHYKSFNIIWISIIISKEYKVTQYQDHDESCCSFKNNEGIITKSFYFKAQDTSWLFFTHWKKNVFIRMCSQRTSFNIYQFPCFS